MMNIFHYGGITMKTRIDMSANGEISLKDGYSRFTQRKRIENRSPASLIFYDDIFKNFCEYQGAETLCSSVTEETIFGFIEFLRERNPAIKDTSINTYLRGIRAILYFLMENGLIPNFKIHQISAEKDIKETYTTAELERLLRKPNAKNCSFAEFRNWAIVCYLLGTGNRARTLCNVKICDLDFQTHEIKLNAVKNKKPYIIPMSRTLEHTLNEYLAYRKGKPDDYLFCNVYGQQITYDALKSAIQRYNHSRGVAKTSIHLFRHTFAKNWILNNGDMFRLQKILGHSSIEIVKEYVNMFGSDLQLNFEVFNPLDNMEIMRRNSGTIKMGKTGA
jgi:integrase/recombinase XerD